MALLALLAIAATTGCKSTTEAANVTISLAGEESLDAPASTAPSSRISQLGDFAQSSAALGTSYTDVTQIRVDVKETVTGNKLYVNYDLFKSAGLWTGTLPFLPKNKGLTFTAHGLDSGKNELFSGVTNQTIVNDNDSVPIVMVPTNDNRNITLPRVKKISVPAEFATGQSGNISVAFEANTGETITYSLTPAAGGGSFFPDSGAVTLLGIAGTFVTQYVPPTVAVVTDFTNEVKVTNSTGQSVTTTFKTRVLPPSATQGGLNTTIQVSWNPVINFLSAKRVADTSNVIWQAVVSDDGPQSELTYAWSFAPNGTFTPVPGFTDAVANPTTFTNYSMLLQGLLTLKVTDGRGGVTTVNYPLTPNQFPDNPVDVGTITGINYLRAGDSHTCALMNNGTVRCWGLGTFGQLGYGNNLTVGATNQPYTAGDVPIVGKAVRLATGGNHSCVLMDSGFVRCWGLNASGQLGYNTTDNVGDAEAIANYGYVNLGGNAVKIATGHDHSCALMDTGKVRCWGLNTNGQLGYGHTSNIGDNEQPYSAGDVQVGGTVQDLVAGTAHTCVLLTTGKVRCWGLNTSGQLGYGNITQIGDNEAPSTAGDVSLGGNAVQLAAGANHTCALLDTGFVRCWGLNSNGQLGYGNTNNIGDNELPTAPGAGDVVTGGKVLQVSAGANHTCVLMSAGNVKCWGLATSGQLGYGYTATLLAPPATATVDMSGASAFQVTTGANHSCALLSTGKARCWGLGASGQLGYGNTNNIGDNELPSAINAGDINVFTPTP